MTVGNEDFQSQRKSLPIYKMRKAILKRIRASDSLIVLGETACGKTTQIPQVNYFPTFNESCVMIFNVHLMKMRFDNRITL